MIPQNKYFSTLVYSLMKEMSNKPIIQIFIQLQFFLFNLILFLNLKHCISFAKHQNESATGIHTLNDMLQGSLVKFSDLIYIVF